MKAQPIRPAMVADKAGTFRFTRLTVEDIPLSIRLESIRYTYKEGATFTWASLPGKSCRIE